MFAFWDISASMVAMRPAIAVRKDIVGTSLVSSVPLVPAVRVSEASRTLPLASLVCAVPPSLLK